MKCTTLASICLLVGSLLSCSTPLQESKTKNFAGTDNHNLSSIKIFLKNRKVVLSDIIAPFALTIDTSRQHQLMQAALYTKAGLITDQFKEDFSTGLRRILFGSIAGALPPGPTELEIRLEFETSGRYETIVRRMGIEVEHPSFSQPHNVDVEATDPVVGTANMSASVPCPGLLPRLKFIVPFKDDARGAAIRNYYLSSVVPRSIEWISSMVSINPSLFPAPEVITEYAGWNHPAVDLEPAQGGGYETVVNTWLPSQLAALDAYMATQDDSLTIPILIVDTIRPDALGLPWNRPGAVTFTAQGYMVVALNGSQLGSGDVDNDAIKFTHEFFHLAGGLGHWSGTIMATHVQDASPVLNTRQRAAAWMHLCSETNMNFKRIFGDFVNPFAEVGDTCGDHLLNSNEECEANFHSGHLGGAGSYTRMWMNAQLVYAYDDHYASLMTTAINTQVYPPEEQLLSGVGANVQPDTVIEWCTGAHSLNDFVYDLDPLTERCKVRSATAYEIAESAMPWGTQLYLDLHPFWDNFHITEDTYSDYQEAIYYDGPAFIFLSGGSSGIPGTISEPVLNGNPARPYPGVRVPVGGGPGGDDRGGDKCEGSDQCGGSCEDPKETCVGATMGDPEIGVTVVCRCVKKKGPQDGGNGLQGSFPDFE